MKFRLVLLYLCTVAAAVQAQKNTEFRAIWVVDEQWMSATSAEENKARTREILDRHRQANLNAVLWQVRRFGNVYYPSKIEPFGKAAGFRDPGYDPLAYAIEEAHKRGLEFHAWMNVFESRSAYPGSPAQKFPEWVCRDRDGNIMPDEIAWLSPGLPEVREYLVQVALEIVKNYDIDGLHLDFVRWNEHTNTATSLKLARRAAEMGVPEGMITEDQLQELLQNPAGRYLYDVQHPYSQGVPEGFSSWEDWWRWSVTEFVRILSDSIRAIKPWVRLSPAALGRYNWGYWQGYNVVYQDAALWFNEGYIQQIMGMHYHWTRPDEFLSILQTGCPECWSQYIQPGIAAGRLYSVGLPSWIFAEKGIWKNHETVVRAVRTINWVDGFQFFSYKEWEDQQYWDDARKKLFPGKAVIRPISKNRPPYPAPTLALTRLDSLTYKIVITPPEGITEDVWVAIYRSEDDQFDVSSDTIVDLYFGPLPYEYIARFDGLQDYNGRYFYYATLSDRYRIESPISNAAQTEAIPSFAPVVVFTNPVEGDTIPVNRPVVLRFSKRMNPETAPGAFQFSPEVAVGQLVWDEEHREVSIYPAQPFAYATEYTLTVTSRLQDVNGRGIDGNGDGVEGDAFVLHFRTLEQDRTGPIIVSSHPPADEVLNNVDIQELLTVVFDEVVDPQTLGADDEIEISLNGARIDANWQMTRLPDRSVMSVQPLQPFEPNSRYLFSLSGTFGDTLGNMSNLNWRVEFETSPFVYTTTRYIDKFFSVSNWWQPKESFQTEGIVLNNTYFKLSAEAYLPAMPARQRTAAALYYEWNPASTERFIRLYLAGGSPRNVLFDTTYVLQCYIFSDGSGNLLRFAVDDSTMDRAEFHEVSQWITLDWYGWRLVEWQLNDPSSVGEWIGDGVLNGPNLRFDSFQLTHVPGAAMRGVVYFDNLRLVKKQSVPVGIAADTPLPTHPVLHQNYPNPFNPSTTIVFELPRSTFVTLSLYNVQGRRVKTLIQQRLPAGIHRLVYEPKNLPSGTYLYVLETGQERLVRRMTFLK